MFSFIELYEHLQTPLLGFRLNIDSVSQKWFIECPWLTCLFSHNSLYVSHLPVTSSTPLHFSFTSICLSPLLVAVAMMHADIWLTQTYVEQE